MSVDEHFSYFKKACCLCYTIQYASFQFYSYPKRLVAKNAQYGQFITNGLKASETVNAQAPKAGMLTFTGNNENKLVIHWETKVREKSLIRVMGLSKTGPTIIGFCLPKLKGRDISEIAIDTYLDLKPAVSIEHYDKHQ